MLKVSITPTLFYVIFVINLRFSFQLLSALNQTLPKRLKTGAATVGAGISGSRC